MEKLNAKDRKGFSDRAAEFIASLILRVQSRIAVWLRNCDARLLPGQRKVVYGILGLIVIAYLCLLMNRALTAPRPHTIKAQWLRVKADTSNYPSDKAPGLLPIEPYRRKHQQLSF